MTTILSKLSYNATFYTLMLMLLSSTVLLFYCVAEQKIFYRNKIILSIFFVIVLIGSASGLIDLMQIKEEAVAKGLYTTNNITIQKIIDNTELAHTEDKLPENYDDLKGKLVMYYRFGCPDCNAIYPEWNEMTKNRKDVYWVSTRSEQGKKLLEKYPIHEVPAGIYIKKDGSYVAYVLYSKTTGEITFLKDDMQTLLDLANRQA